MPNSPVPERHPRLLLALISSGVFLVQLDATIVAIALPDVQAHLGVGVGDLQWIVAGYTLMLAGLLLTAGTLGDRFGHRRLFLGGLVAFTAASALCALAPTFEALLAARILQGGAGSVLIPVSLALISTVFPDPRARAKAIGTWAGIGGLALAAGPLLGGVLVGAFGWPSIFWVNIPVGVAAALALRRLLPNHRPQGTRSLDPLGQLLFAASIAALTYALIEGGRDWTATPVVAALVVATAGLVVFVRWELRHPDPMVPIRLFRSPVVLVAGAVNLFGLLGLYGGIFLLTLYLQQVNRLSAAAAGLRFLALNLAIMIFSYLASVLAAKLGPRPPIVAGSTLTAIGLLALTGLGVGTGYEQYWWALALLGAGVSLVGAPATVALLSAVPPEQAGAASGISNTFRQLGSVFGVAVCGTLLVSHLRAELPTRLPALPAAAIDPLSSGDLSIIDRLPIDLRQPAFDVSARLLVEGLHLGALVAAACALLAGVTALLFLPRSGAIRPLSQSQPQVRARRGRTPRRRV
ncbi:MFS transporter [Saccharopolyspora elongata]|uniref:DHA2 family efflux MFS transporter permease subunit n=1 Tax=Saccharopolyspora elongata TaxID=2530387 RepID=A0A4R4Z363_9PSEU|nr:MFS transporter [Saccharopolyspora elongata]TDD52501.1 DHA2 family efflux MFS transporter permease subunit [Saccharopolyspora elongata]